MPDDASLKDDQRDMRARMLACWYSKEELSEIHDRTGRIVAAVQMAGETVPESALYASPSRWQAVADCVGPMDGPCMRAILVLHHDVFEALVLDALEQAGVPEGRR